MKNILFVTGSRADYGILRRLLKLLDNDPQIDLKIVATGTHMEAKYGNTYTDIENDGFRLFKKIPLHIKNSTNKEIIREISTLSIGMSRILEETNIDLIIILGDRYEMLAVANTAAIYNVPICHFHGGEVTLGNYDEYIRHAITKLSYIHLTSTEEYRRRVIQMGESPNRVVNTGSLGVENVLSETLLPFNQLKQRLNLSLFSPKSYYVCLFHPTTLESIEKNKGIMNNVLSLLANESCVFIGSNSDTGSDDIMGMIINDVNNNSNHVLFKSLHTIEYHSLIKNSKGLIGNSSSGIIEVPSLGVATLNIGNRQKGRVRGKSVIDVGGLNYLELVRAFSRMKMVTEYTNPYEKCNSAEIAFSKIKETVFNNQKKVKNFFDIRFNSKE